MKIHTSKKILDTQRVNYVTIIRIPIFQIPIQV